MYSKIGKEYAENHSDCINTCSVLPYGIKFVGIEAGDEEGGKHNEKAVFYKRGGIKTALPNGQKHFQDEEIIMSMDDLSELHKQINIYDIKKNGMAKMILDCISSGAIHTVKIFKPEYADKHVIRGYLNIFLLEASTVEEITDDSYEILGKIISEYPCVVGSSMDNGCLKFNVSEQQETNSK